MARTRGEEIIGVSADVGEDEAAAPGDAKTGSTFCAGSFSSIGRSGTGDPRYPEKEFSGAEINVQP
jgi:hypothetical protein